MKNFKKIISLLLIFCLVLSACSQSANKPQDTKKDENEEKSKENSLFKAGTYEATGKDGFKGDIKIKTTFSNDKIEKIEIVESKETPDIGGKAIDTLSKDIVENQSLGLDAISGATFSSKAFLAAIEDCATQAGADIETLKKPLQKKVTDKAQEVETDVLVIGGGGAGLSAAISAAQEGKKVILLEKAATLGGNTIRAGWPYNAVDPDRQAKVAPADEASMAKIEALTTKEAKNERHKELQEELKKDIEAYKSGQQDYLFDSPALHKLQTYDGGDYVGNLELIEKLVDGSLPTSEWMASNGVVWKDEITTVPGGLWPRAHLPQNAAGGDYIKASENKAKELGIDIKLNCPATELLVENGKVIGAKATNDGSELTVKSKAVVVATGGFAGNTEMRKKYMPSLLDSLPTTNAPSVTGDGLVMGEKVGAQFVGMEYIQSLPLGNPADGSLNAWMGGSGVENYYQVNKQGLRFMAEDGRRDVMTKALLEQEDAMSYVISSADNSIEVNDKNQNIWGDDVEKLVAEGKIFRADTIEELAKQIDIDPEVLKKTHDTFNQYVTEGKDSEFGRTLFGKELVTAPFYASPRVPTVHHTMGGLKINLNCEVLDANDQVIPGLFAAGEVTGGIHGANRLGGNALVDIHVFGRTAGENAAKFAK